VLHVVGGEFRQVAWEPGPQEQQIRALAFDAAGDLWIGMRDRGVVRLHDGVLAAAMTTHDGLPSDDIRSLHATRDGAMWIGTFHGLVRWADGRLTRAPAPLDSVAVHSIANDAGGVWCATDKGLLRLRDGAVESVGTDRLVASEVSKVLFDRDGNLWIGMRTGLARMTTDGQIERLPSPEVSVNALFEDADGNLWIGNDRGLDRLRIAYIGPELVLLELLDIADHLFGHPQRAAQPQDAVERIVRIKPRNVPARLLHIHVAPADAQVAGLGLE